MTSAIRSLPLPTLLASLALVATLSCATLAQTPEGETPAPSLEEMLGQALANNPDLRVARARLEEARANLRRAELEVTRQTITLFHQRQRQIELVETLTMERDRAAALYESGVATSEQLYAATAALVEAQALQATLAVDERFVLGLGESPYLVEGPLAAPPQHVLSESTRRALQATLTVDFQDTPLGEVLDFLGTVSGLTFITPPTLQARLADPVSARLSDVSTRSVLTALGDITGLVFVVREYGLLVSLPSVAAGLGAETIPPVAAPAPRSKGRDGRR